MKSKMIANTKVDTWEPAGGSKRRLARKILMLAGVLMLLSSAASYAQERDGRDNNRAFLPAPVRPVSTVPPNGDQNPYGVAFVPRGFPAGTVNPGDILVSNFNNSQNVQGTGTTIVRIPANAAPSVFFQGTSPPTGLGLTTALNVLRKGFVLVGNFPATCGSDPGSIVVIDSNGMQVGALADSFIDGPWDSTVFDRGDKALLFVANALNGTVARLNLVVGAGGVTIKSETQIASGYGHACDPVTFVDGPTGLVYDPEKDVLYVASTVDNAIFAIPDAGGTKADNGKGALIYQDNVHLHGPLAMAMAPNGHLIVSNNDVINSDPNHPSEYTEFTIGGRFVKQISVDPAQGGSFGLAIAMFDDAAKLAVVDDNTADLLIWTLKLP
jgi:hypothetical protein